MCGSVRIAAASAGLLLLIALLVHPLPIPAAETDNIRLQWAFGALTGPESSPRLLLIEKNAVLKSGDRIKMFLRPLTACHLYLFYRSSQEELAVMLPEKGSRARVASGIPLTLPDGSRWFQLDAATGPETFYLLVSVQPLESLDTLCRKLFDAGEDSEREAAGREIYAEVKRLLKKHRTLSVAAERPVRIGGNFRGAGEDTPSKPPDLSQIAVEISASDFYSRTFTIDHR